LRYFNCGESGSDASLQIIVFAHVAQGKNGDGLAVPDFEKCCIAGVAEGDQQFAEERRLGSGFPAFSSMPLSSPITLSPSLYEFD